MESQDIKVTENIESSDEAATKYKPSDQQIKYLIAAINLGTYDNKAACAKEAGVVRQYWWDWIHIDGFYEWFQDEFNRAIKSLIFELDAIGFKLAKTDFKYWEAMQKKYGGLVSKDGINIKVKAEATAKTEVIVGAEEASERLDRNLGIIKRLGKHPQLFSKN